MKHLLLLAPLALAACHSGPSVDATNASAKEVDAKLAASGGAQFLSPGRWEGSAAITDMQIPGMAPEMAARMKEEMGQNNSFASCLTAEEAKKPAAGFFSGNESDCRYDHFTMANGRLDAAMTCQNDGAPQVATMKGNFTSDSWELTMTSKSAGKPGTPMSGYTMAMKMNAHRTGACRGDEKS